MFETELPSALQSPLYTQRGLGPLAHLNRLDGELSSEFPHEAYENQRTPSSNSNRFGSNARAHSKYSLFGQNQYFQLPTPSQSENPTSPSSECIQSTSNIERKNPLVQLYESRQNVKSGAKFHVLKITNYPTNWKIDDVKKYFHPIQV